MDQIFTILLAGEKIKLKQSRIFQNLTEIQRSLGQHNIVAISIIIVSYLHSIIHLFLSNFIQHQTLTFGTILFRFSLYQNVSRSNIKVIPRQVNKQGELTKHVLKHACKLQTRLFWQSNICMIIIHVHANKHTSHVFQVDTLLC